MAAEILSTDLGALRRKAKMEDSADFSHPGSGKGGRWPEQVPKDGGARGIGAGGSRRRCLGLTLAVFSVFLTAHSPSPAFQPAHNPLRNSIWPKLAPASTGHIQLHTQCTGCWCAGTWSVSFLSCTLSTVTRMCEDSGNVS